MNSLRDQIMNLPYKHDGFPHSRAPDTARNAYLLGHEEACRAAAELTVAYDARIRQLEDVVRRYVASDVERDAYHDDTTMQDSDLHRCARAALKDDPS